MRPLEKILRERKARRMIGRRPENTGSEAV